MKKTIYLTVSRNGVGNTVRQNLPTNLQRGKVPVKINIEIADNAFAPPILEQNIKIEDAYRGIDFEDVHFNGSTITEAEAELIRQQRLTKAAEILKANGYTVEKGE